jgi:hypothetical protein
MTTQIIQSLSRSHDRVRPYFSISVTYGTVIGENAELQCDDRQSACALQLLLQWSVVKTSLQNMCWVTLCARASVSVNVRGRWILWRIVFVVYLQALILVWIWTMESLVHSRWERMSGEANVTWLDIYHDIVWRDKRKITENLRPVSGSRSESGTSRVRSTHEQRIFAISWKIVSCLK